MSDPTSSGVLLHFFAGAGGFLAAAGDYLAADPVVSTVVTTSAHRVLSQLADGVAAPKDHWWLTVTDESGTVVGAGMRTAPFAPHPAFLLPMPDEAAVALARAMHERGEPVLAVNGVLPAVRVFAEEVARLTTGRVAVAQHTRLHELGELRRPASGPGALVAATEADLDLATAWFAAFVVDADEQAGRARSAAAHESPDRADVLGRIRAQRLWFWVDDSGAPVSLTGVNPPAFGVARVGPVYTPPGERGRGWASSAVAEVSARIVAAGSRACLFTDQANPTSNKIYAALGYRPVVDMADLAIVALVGRGVVHVQPAPTA